MFCSRASSGIVTIERNENKSLFAAHKPDNNDTQTKQNKKPPSHKKNQHTGFECELEKVERRGKNVDTKVHKQTWSLKSRNRNEIKIYLSFELIWNVVKCIH